MAKAKTAKINTAAYKYDILKVRGKDGKLHYSSGNGDAVHRAMLLHVASGGTMKQIIDANKLDVDAKNTNMGLVRMSVGVALRGKLRAKQPVKIGKTKVSKLTQKVVLPKVEMKTPAPRKASKKARKANGVKKASRSSARRKVATPAPVEVAQEAAAS